MDRRRFLETAGAALAALPGCGGWTAGPRRRGRPNLLFLMTDEQHHRSLSVAGNPYIETPHMDRIAREGVRFTAATCVTPYCSPSRASIVTGVYPHRHGILRNVSPKRGKQPPLAHDAFPNTECLLHAAGYATAHRGKWHLGDKGSWPCYVSMGYAGPRGAYHRLLRERLPAGQFADETDPGRYLGRPVEKTEAVRRGWKAFHAIPDNRLAYIATIGRTVVPPELLPETQITDQVLALLDEHKDEAFMITASWSPPHDLWVVPEPYYSMVDRSKVAIPGSRDLPPWDRRGPSKRLGEVMGDEGIREYIAVYHGMVQYIDDQVGRILDRLDALGLAGNTLVVFTTDHGDMVGAHGCIGKSIASFFDDLVRLPLAMRFPGRIPPGTVVDAPVSQVDLMPTLLDYLGQPVPAGLHGRSMRPLVEGRKVSWRDHAFCQRADRLRMLRTARWKYAVGHKHPMLALYDLEADPHENHNLAAEPAHASTVRSMHARLLGAMTADGDPLAAKLPRDPLA
ncbi:MAG: sulfatase [Candidatus Brocadiia bacterium]